MLAKKDVPGSSNFSIKRVRTKMAPKHDDRQPPVAGQPAPDFSLLNTDNAAFTLSAGLQERPLVLVFYRGDW